MNCQKLLDRITTLNQNLGDSSQLQILHNRLAQGEEPNSQQLQYLLHQELQYRQRLSGEIEILTRQLRLYLKWQEGKTEEVESQPEDNALKYNPLHSALSSVWDNPLARQRIAKAKALAETRQATEIDRRRFQDLFNSAPDGYVITDAEGIILEANATASNWLGVSIEQLVGQSFLGFLEEENQKQTLLEIMAKVAQTKELSEQCEITLATDEDSPLSAAVRLSAHENPEDGTVQFRCLLRDHSESQEIHQALNTSEKKWRALFNQSFQIMALLDAQGKVIDLNQTALELVQGTLEQVYGEDFAEIPWWLTPSDRSQVKQSIKLAQVGGIVRYEVELLTENGELVPIDLSLKPVRDETEQVVLLIAEGRDLRDRVHKETELRREKEISDSILKSLPGVFYMMEKNGPCIRWNQELEKITGYTKSEIETLDFLDFFIKSDQSQVEDKITEAFKQGKSTVEATFKSKDQHTTTCHFSNIRVRLDDEQEYLIGIGIDITESNRVKSERQKLATLVENSQDLISLTKLNGQVEFLNPAGQNLLGINLSNYPLPLSLEQCFSSQSQQQFDQEIFPSILQTEQWYGELELKNHQTGAVLAVLANIFLIRDPHTATPMNLGVITRNISSRKETEIALKTSEERFRSIFEQAAMGIALLDISGRFQRVNQRGCEILGYDQEELLTRNYHELIASEQLAENDQSVQELLRRKVNTFSQEQRYRRKDGNWVWVNLTMSLMCCSQEQPQSLLAILEDISDRKIAEAALQKSEEEYRSLVNGIREVIFQVNIHGNWCFLNPAWTEITGYSVEETIGKPFLNYTYFEDFAYNREQFQRLIHEQKKYCRYEVRYQTQNGGFCWMEVTARVTKNADREITGITGTLNDVTERRQAEDQLRAVINTVPGLVSWVSRDGHYLGVNQQLAHTLNQEPEEFVGKEIGFMNRSSSFVRFMYEFLASGEKFTSQVLESKVQGGETRSFLMAAQKYRQASAAVLIGIDITERKQAELALKESENQFRQLAENIEQVFWMVDLTEQNFIYISPAYESTWGRSVQSAYDSPTDWLEAIHPDDYQKVLYASRKQIRGEYDQEYRIVRPNGEIRWIHDRAFPVRDERGKVYRIAGIAEDITERKQAKEALKKRERYLKALVGVQRRLLASAVDESLYQEVLAILGEACEASRIYVYENFVDEEGKPRGRECAQWCATKSCPQINHEAHQNFSYQEYLGTEAVAQLEKGEFLQKIVSDLPEEKQAFFDEQNILSFLMIPLIVNGEFFGVIGFDNCEANTTWGRLEVGLLSSAAAAIALAKEKQLTQETLQQQLTAIETTTDGIMIMGASGQIHYVNPAYCQMLGYESPTALLETQWRNHHPSEELPRIQNEIFPQLQSQGGWNGDVCAQHKNGHTFIQELSMNLTDNGEIVGVCRDISDRKQAEEQLKASLEEKELLLKEVHHRVKNNLQVISSIFSLQSQTLEDEHALAIIEESQNRINSMALIHEKLYQSPNLANVDFAEYIRDLTYHLLASYNVNPDWIQTDMNIESIALNLDSAIPCGLLINELVSNSLKHGFPNQRSGTIHIFLGVKDSEQEMLCLKVEDDGVGLPENFNPRKSTSLGVSLITSLTQQLRGKLKFQNNPGASFEITFPKPIERKRF